MLEVDRDAARAGVFDDLRVDVVSGETASEGEGCAGKWRKGNGDRAVVSARVSGR